MLYTVRHLPGTAHWKHNTKSVSSEMWHCIIRWICTADSIFGAKEKFLWNAGFHLPGLMTSHPQRFIAMGNYRCDMLQGISKKKCRHLLLKQKHALNTLHTMYKGYSESKYRLCISLAHPRDCPFAHVQWLPLSIEKPQTPFREIRVMFMFVSVC